MSFYDEIEARYDACLKKTDGVTWDQDPQWYIAYAELAFLRSAHLKAKEDKEAMIKAAVEAAVEVALRTETAKGGTHD